MYKHGLIAGKFYPLHKGHMHLIETALSHSERVTLFLVEGFDQSPDVQTRFVWLKETFPNLDVRVICDLFSNDDDPASNLEWARYTNDILEGDTVDAVFSSENYAVGWAKALGAEHVCVDLYRSYMPISGTEIRNDPYKNWAYLSPAARPFYAKHVLIVGAESVGKSTLCKKLAQELNTVFVPEYGRIYVERQGSVENTDHRVIFAEVINKTIKMRKDLIKDANRVIIHDTDFYTSYLWYGEWGNDAKDGLGKMLYNKALEDTQMYDLVLVLNHKDTVFVDDGFREQTARVREHFTEALYDFHLGQGFNVKMLNGTYKEREDQAIRHINDLFVS